MKPLLVAVTCIILAGVAATTAHAGTFTDPRKCTNATSKADCARNAAKLVARQVLQKRVGMKYLWQGPMTCTGAGSLLRWRCSFTDQFPQLPPSGYVAVTYRATSAGWVVRTQIVATG